MVNVHAPENTADNSPAGASAPAGPARSVLPVHDEPDRGRWGDSNRIAPGLAPVLRDELAAVVTEQQYPRERLRTMKVAVTATVPSLDAAMDSRFGRCSFFVIVETNDMTFESVENANNALGGGAGIQSAQLMAEKGVKVVLTGNCGPNAHQTLVAAGIDVVVGCNGTVSEIIERFKSGQLRAASAPNVESHSGTR
jgi:predicted Fe-Mo cluster-binding NifX family protein